MILVAQGRRIRGVDLLFIAFGLLGAILYQVKYTVLIPITAGLILGVLVGDIRASVRTLALWSCGGVAASIMVYLVGFAALNPQSLGEGKTYLEISQHVLGYLLSGILAFSEFMRSGAQQFYGSESAILIPFHNLWAVVLRGRIVGLKTLSGSWFDRRRWTQRERDDFIRCALPYLGWLGMLTYGLSSVCAVTSCSGRPVVTRMHGLPARRHCCSPSSPSGGSTSFFGS